MADQCDGCKFIRTRAYGARTVLECRFSDPFAHGQKGYWPEVLATDWCGKFMPVAAQMEETPGGLTRVA